MAKRAQSRTSSPSRGGLEATREIAKRVNAIPRSALVALRRVARNALINEKENEKEKSHGKRKTVINRKIETESHVINKKLLKAFTPS